MKNRYPNNNQQSRPVGYNPLDSIFETKKNKNGNQLPKVLNPALPLNPIMEEEANEEDFEEAVDWGCIAKKRPGGRHKYPKDAFLISLNEYKSDKGKTRLTFRFGEDMLKKLNWNVSDTFVLLFDKKNPFNSMIVKHDNGYMLTQEKTKEGKHKVYRIGFPADHIESNLFNSTIHSYIIDASQRLRFIIKKR